MKRFTRVLLLAIALMAVAVVVAACSGGGAAVPEACQEEGACAVIPAGESIKVGFSGPMVGDVSNYGIDMSQGAELGLADSGQIEGFDVELVAEDDQGSPEGGAAVANKFVSDQEVVAVAGPAFSGATRAATPIYEAANIPMVSMSATAPDLTQSDSAVFNRVIFSDLVQGSQAASFLADTLGKSKIALLHDGTTYGQGLCTVAQGALGDKAVAFEAITPGETDYSAVLTQIAALEPDAMLYCGYHPEAAALVNGFAKAGLEGLPFVSDDGIFGSSFVELAGENAEGVIATSPSEPASSSAKDAFDAKYLETYGTAAGELSTYTWTAYDAGLVIHAAIKKVAILGGDGNLYIPRAALVEAVRATSGVAGVTGTMSCDATGECAAAVPGLWVVQDGAWVPYE